LVEWKKELSGSQYQMMQSSISTTKGTTDMTQPAFTHTSTIPSVPTLTFEQTSKVMGRMQGLARQSIGNMELITGEIDGSEVALCVDSMVGGGSVVVTWARSPDRE
jgi:hypothetical protein